MTEICFGMTANEPRWCEESRWCENPFSHLRRRSPSGVGSMMFSAGSSPDLQRGSRNVATGGVSRYSGRRNPWVLFNSTAPAPKGRRKAATPDSLRPSGADRLPSSTTTGSASSAFRRTALHPWLHPATPPGSNSDRRKCPAPSGIMVFIARWTLRCSALACVGAWFIILGPSIALAQQDPPKPSPPQTAPDRPNEEQRKEPDVDRQALDKKAVDKQAEELGKRLLRKAVAESDEDVMATMLRLMGESERKLGIDFDPGDETQQLQSSILDKLNDAIKTAGKRRMSRGGQASWSSDRRRAEGAAKPQPPPEANRKSSGTGSGDAEGTTTPTTAAETKPVRGDLQETRRSWGLLPQRERDEMIQGSSEGYIERYREWIERYYRALQESGE